MPRAANAHMGKRPSAKSAEGGTTRKQQLTGEKMFETGEKIVYGVNGVCTVTGTCVSPFGGGDLRVYYTLQPLDDNASVIYTPAEGGRVVMRPLVSPAEAEEILAGAATYGELSVHSEKQRRDIYRAALASTDPREYVRIIRTVEHRKAIALRTHRHIAITDTEFERGARYCLFNEFAIVLGKTYAEIESAFKTALESAQPVKE